MKLVDLLGSVDYEILIGSADTEVNNLVYDSRKVKSGDAFVCISGARSDGHDFVGQVIESGASAVIVEKDIDLESIDSDVAVVKVKSSRYGLACMAAAYFDHPAGKLVTIGVTGTK